VKLCGLTARSIDEDNCKSTDRSRLFLSQTVHTLHPNLENKPTTTEIDNIIKSLEAEVYIDMRFLQRF